MTEYQSEDTPAGDVQDPAEPKHVDTAVETQAQPVGQPEDTGAEKSDVDPNKGYSVVAGEPASNSTEESADSDESDDSES